MKIRILPQIVFIFISGEKKEKSSNLKVILSITVNFKVLAICTVYQHVALPLPKKIKKYTSEYDLFPEVVIHNGGQC